MAKFSKVTHLGRSIFVRARSIFQLRCTVAQRC